MPHPLLSQALAAQNPQAAMLDPGMMSADAMTGMMPGHMGMPQTSQPSMAGDYMKPPSFYGQPEQAPPGGYMQPPSAYGMPENMPPGHSMPMAPPSAYGMPDRAPPKPQSMAQMKAHQRMMQESQKNMSAWMKQMDSYKQAKQHYDKMMQQNQPQQPQGPAPGGPQ